MANVPDGKISVSYAARHEGTAQADAALSDDVKSNWAEDLALMDADLAVLDADYEGGNDSVIDVLTKFLEHPDVTNEKAALVFEALDLGGVENDEFNAEDLNGLDGADVLAIIMTVMYPGGDVGAARSFGVDLGLDDETVNTATDDYEDHFDELAIDTLDNIYDMDDADYDAAAKQELLDAVKHLMGGEHAEKFGPVENFINGATLAQVKVFLDDMRALSDHEDADNTKFERRDFSYLNRSEFEINSDGTINIKEEPEDTGGMSSDSDADDGV